MKLLSKFFYFVIILAIIFTADISQADKHNKKGDKHKNATHKPNQQAHKNSTMGHDHKNHTSVNTNHTAVPNQNDMFIHNEQQAAHPNNPSNVGWSLNQNQAQHHQNNPNGYVMQHHDNPQSTSHLHQQNANVPQQQQQQGGSNFGGIALGAAGGLASGAIGGYLLSNALNSGSSGSKSGEKETEAPLVQNINVTTVSISDASTSESTTLVAENNTLSSTVEMLDHTETSTIAQSTQSTPEPNKATSTIKLSIYVGAFLSLFIKIFL